MDAREFIICGKNEKSGNILDIINPYTGSPFEKVYLGDEAAIEAAISGSLNSFKETSSLPAYKRKEILERLAILIEERKEEFIEILIKEGGKIRSLASGEVDRAVETIRISAEESVRQAGEIIPLDRTEGGENYTCFSRRFPVGTVLAITPFNYPLNLACHKIGPAIAAGNPFILKPASKTPLSGLLLGELTLEAGYVPEAVSVIPCSSDLTEKMATDERIAFLSFTGSAPVGWHLRKVAGRMKVSLELGGNAAVIVHSDADLDLAASRIVTGACANAGQVCISVQRVLIQNQVFSEFVEKLRSGFNSLKYGNPDDPDTLLGPMVSQESAEKAWSKIQDALSKGAKMTAGGEFDGTLMAPVLLEQTTPEMEVNSTEIFAPVITVSGYDKFEDAISMANSSDYGLQMGVFTSDIENILYSFERGEAGGIIVNDIPTFRMDVMPYGGIKNSGLGREGPAYAIEEMTEMKIMVIRKKRIA